MCGRRQLETKPSHRPKWGDMHLNMVSLIAGQVPPRPFVVQFHWNGEPLLYDHFSRAVDMFSHCITGMNTNGKLLVEKADEIIGRLDTVTLSVIEKDPERDEQVEILEEFLKLKGDEKPHMTYRLLGDVDPRPWKKYPGVVAPRLLHDPLGSYGYERQVTIPEMGVCLDMLHSVAVDRYGNAESEGRGYL